MPTRLTSARGRVMVMWYGNKDDGNDIMVMLEKDGNEWRMIAVMMIMMPGPSGQVLLRGRCWSLSEAGAHHRPIDPYSNLSFPGTALIMTDWHGILLLRPLLRLYAVICSIPIIPVDTRL